MPGLRHTPLTLITALIFALTACAGGDDPFLTEVNQGGNQSNQNQSNQNQANQNQANQNQANQNQANQNQANQNQANQNQANQNQAQHECDDPSDCPSPEMDCVDDGTGVRICVEPPGDPCLADIDCSQGEMCGVMVNGAGSELQTVCVPDNAQGSLGAACSDHDDCRSRLCHGGLCASPCNSGSHCGEFYLCLEQEAEKDGVQDDLDLCFEVPICSSPVDCTATDSTCNLVFEDENEDLYPACGFENPGQSGLGSACGDHDVCESNFCWASDDGTTGECSVFCEQAARDCGAGQVCVAFTENISACLSSCDNNADCPGGNVCHLTINQQTNALETYCDSTLGTGATGDECTGPLDCDSGFCLTMSYGQYTETPCSIDANCDAGFTCECPMDNPNCLTSERRCAQVTSENRCSELCNPANGDSDCQSPNHDLGICDTNVTVTWDSGSESVAACATALD